MAQTDVTERLKKLAEEFDSLCKDAGISAQALEKAREGRFIPYGALGDEVDGLSQQQNNQLYWDYEHDAIRGKIRKLIFSVPDMDMRKRLIAKHSEIEDAVSAAAEKDIFVKQREIDVTRGKSASGGWVAGAIIGGLCVFVGYRLFRLAGAIGGAIVGFFIGQYRVLKARSSAKEVIQILEAELAELQKSLATDRVQPRFFSNSERFNGEENKTFDRESAFGNRMGQYFKKS